MSNKFSLRFRIFLKKIRKKIDSYIEVESVDKADAVRKTIYLLERDFTLEEQNEVLILLIHEVNNEREKRIISMQKELANLELQTQLLKEKVVLTNI